MAKVKQPLLSFDARRKLGDDIVFKRQGRTAIVESRPIPADARSVGQLSWRHMFLKVVALWHALSAAEKEAWESLARPRHMTGYAWFVSQALRPNPGIYLPLQGGIMTGEILMGTNSIRGLPLPTGSGHATRKSYVDLFARVTWIDAPSAAVNDLNRTTDLAHTDLDLTALTSANAKFAFLLLRIKIDSITHPADAYFQVRKNGTTPSYVPTVWVNSAKGHTAGTYHFAHTLVGLDSGQVIEYTIQITGTIQVDCLISVLGYIE